MSTDDRNFVEGWLLCVFIGLVIGIVGIGFFVIEPKAERKAMRHCRIDASAHNAGRWTAIDKSGKADFEWCGSCTAP